MDKNIEQIVEDYTQIVKQIEETEKENEQLKIMIYDIYNFIDDIEGRLKNVLKSFNKEEE